jgi:hypothetical protein
MGKNTFRDFLLMVLLGICALLVVGTVFVPGGAP